MATIKLLERYASIQEAIPKPITIHNEKMVCLHTSNFMFSFLLSFVIELYNFFPLTAIAKIQGMAIIFCKNMLDRLKINAFPQFHTCKYRRYGIANT